MSECGHPVNTMNAQIRNLQERLLAVEVERDSLRAALLPFAREATHAEIAPRSAFELAAALVASTSPPPSARVAAGPGAT